MAGQRSTRAKRRAAAIPPRPRSMVSADIAAEPALVPTPAAETVASTRPRRGVLPPPDYTEDYVVARRDLRRIALFAIILFVLMLGLYFSGVLRQFV